MACIFIKKANNLNIGEINEGTYCQMGFLCGVL